MSRKDAFDQSLDDDFVQSVSNVFLRFFPTVKAFPLALPIATNMLWNIRKKGSWLGSGSRHHIKQNFADFSASVLVLRDVIPSLISENEAHVDDLILRGAGETPEVRGAMLRRTQLEELGKLVEQTYPLADLTLTRRRDPRSEWHQTARTLATYLEIDLTRQKARKPSRNSIKSPTVATIRDLLRLAGRNETDDAVRKALVGKYLRR